MTSITDNVCASDATPQKRKASRKTDFSKKKIVFCVAFRFFSKVLKSLARDFFEKSRGRAVQITGAFA